MASLKPVEKYYYNAIVRQEPKTKIFIVQICKADEVNSDGHIYTKKTLEKQCINTATLIESKSFMCELESSDAYSLPIHQNNGSIHLHKASHLITDLWMDDDKLMAEIQFLDTPSGRIASSLFEKDSLKFRMRGVGGNSYASLNSIVISENYCLVQISAYFKEPYNKPSRLKYRSIDDE